MSLLGVMALLPSTATALDFRIISTRLSTWYACFVILAVGFSASMVSAHRVGW